MKKKITIDIEVLLPTKVTKEVELPMFLYEEIERSYLMYVETENKYMPYEKHEIKFYSDEQVRYFKISESDSQFKRMVATIGDELQPCLKEEFLEAFKTYINNCVDTLNAIAAIEE